MSIDVVVTEEGAVEVTVTEPPVIEVTLSNSPGATGGPGPQGPEGPDGPQGPEGPPGSGETVVHTQLVPSDLWTINHTWAGGFPAVSVVDSAGTIVTGQVTYVSTTVLTISFAYAFAGKAYLN